MLKKKELWISFIVSVAVYFILGYFTGYDGWFPFVHYFNIPTVLSWGTVLYLFLVRGLTAKRSILCAIAVIVFALPHVLFTLLVYSSWFCVGASVFIAALLLVRAYREKNKRA